MRVILDVNVQQWIMGFRVWDLAGHMLWVFCGSEEPGRGGMVAVGRCGGRRGVGAVRWDGVWDKVGRSLERKERGSQKGEMSHTVESA